MPPKLKTKQLVHLILLGLKTFKISVHFSNLNQKPQNIFFLNYLALICGASSQHLSFLHPCKSLAARENQFVANRAEQRILESKRRHGPNPRQFWSRNLYEIISKFV